MTPIEAVATAQGPRIVSRPKVYEPRKAGLTASQIRWCADNLKAFSWPKCEVRK